MNFERIYQEIVLRELINHLRVNEFSQGELYEEVRREGLKIYFRKVKEGEYSIKINPYSFDISIDKITKMGEENV